MESRPGPAGAAGRSLLSLLLLPFLAAHVLFPLAWIAVLAQQGPWPNDWLHLKIVADHFVAGDLARLYSVGPDAINPGFFWRYPPFALYLAAPLAWLPDTAAYYAVAGLQVAALGVAVAVLRRLAPPGQAAPEWTLAMVFSAPALSTVVVGQNSALLLLCVVAAAALWTRGRIITACLFLGLLAVKPNWGVFFGFYALVSGHWRGAAVMAAVAVGLVVSSLPLGLDLWGDFFRTSAPSADILAHYETYKLITLKGFLDALIGRGAATTTLWLATSAGLCWIAAHAWRRPGPPLRQLGLVLLLAVATNPYASFYDALLLAVPAAAWWTERHFWRPGQWRAVGWMIAVAWCWEQYLYTWSNVLELGSGWYPSFSIVGPVAAAWLVLAVLESRAWQPPFATGGAAPPPG